MSAQVEMEDLRGAGHPPSREYEDLTQRASSVTSNKGAGGGGTFRDSVATRRPRTAPSTSRLTKQPRGRAVTLNSHKNGVHGMPVKVIASNLNDALDRAGRALHLPFAARKMFIRTGDEITSDDEFWSLENGATVYVTHLAGEAYLDPFSASFRNERSMTRKVAWSTGGVQFDKSTRANQTAVVMSPRLERLAGTTNRRVLTYCNGSNGNGQIIVCAGHKSHTTAADAPVGHTQFLKTATAKLGMAANARKVYDLDLSEIKDMTDAPVAPPDLRCLMGAMGGPVWVMAGGRLSADGQLAFIERTLGDAEIQAAALMADVQPRAVRHSTWMPAGTQVMSVPAPPRSDATTSSNEERAVEVQLAVDYLKRMRTLVRQKKAELEEVYEGFAQSEDPNDLERSARIERLSAADGVLKFSVVENGMEDMEQNCVVVLINVGKELARGASSADLLRKLIDLASMQVQPSRGIGKKLFWRKPTSSGQWEVLKMSNVQQWGNATWLDGQGLVEPPTFFLSCGEPFLEWENNMVTLSLTGADALATDTGKIQVRQHGFEEHDPRAVISGLSKSGKSGKGRAAMVFSSLLEVPEPLFQQVVAEEVEGETFCADDATVCLLPHGGIEAPQGRQFYRPRLSRDATTDHCHTAGQQLKAINKWEQWTIDRQGAVDEQGKSVSDYAAFIKSKLLPDLVLTEAENPHGLGFEVLVAKRESRNPRQLWRFHNDGTISPLSSPTKYLTFHQGGDNASSSAAAAYAAYVNLAAQVSVKELAPVAVSENALQITAHAAAPVGSNAHPADCETHVLTMIHTSDSMAKVISAVRSSVVMLTEQCHEKGISDIQLATFDNDFHHCGLGRDDNWRDNIRRYIRVGNGTDYMLPCEFLFRYLRESKENFDSEKCHRVHVVVLADGRAKRRPNQSWLDDCSGLIAELQKKHILVNIHVVSVAQSSQFDFLYPLSEICRDRGTMDYISGAGTTADEQIEACFGGLLRRWLSSHGVPFIPLLLHLADGTAEGFEVYITADSQEPARDRELSKWRHKVMFSGSTIVRLTSQDAVAHVRHKVHESLLVHQDGRQPNDTVVWNFDAEKGGIESIQAVLALLVRLERDWLRAILRADDTFGHALGDHLAAFGAELRNCREMAARLEPIPRGGLSFSTAGRVPAEHDGANQAAQEDIDATNAESERHTQAIEQMTELLKMHIMEDQAMEAIGSITKYVAGTLPGMQMRDRTPLRFFFDPAKRYTIRMATEPRHFGLKGNTARLFDNGSGLKVPWQFAPVIGKPDRYTVRTCWRETNRDRRRGFSLGVSNGNIQLYAAHDFKNLAEWEVTLESVAECTFTMRYRALIPGKGSDGMHAGFSDEGNGKLLPQSKPVVPWVIECLEETKTDSADLAVEERLNQLDLTLGGEEFEWDADQDEAVQQALAGLGASTNFASFQDAFDSAYYHRPQADISAFEDAFQGAQTNGLDTAVLRATYRSYRVAQVLMASVAPSEGVYESILDELPYTFKYNQDGIISEDEFANGITDLMINLSGPALAFVKHSMSSSTGVLNFTKFEESWGVADRIARARADREALAADGAAADSGDSGDTAAGSQTDIVLSTQPKARRDRPARNQQWGLHQPGFQTVGQWRLCRNESLEWQKQALVWPTPQHHDGKFNEDLHWPLHGVLVAHAPWNNENDALKRMLPRTTAKVPTALFVRVVPNGVYDDETEAYSKAVSIQVPLAMIEGSDDGIKAEEKSRSPKKKGLGQLPVPTQQWLNRSRGRNGVANESTPEHQQQNTSDDPRLVLLLQACTRTFDYTVPARKFFDADGKMVYTVASLCDRERERRGERQQLLYVSRGEAFGEGPREPGQCAAPTPALQVAPTFAAIIYRMGEDDNDENTGQKVTARPEKRANALVKDTVGLRSYLDEVGKRLNLSNYVRALHYHDGTELASLQVEYASGGMERVWPKLWVSCGEPFIPPEDIPANIYRREQKEISGAMRHLRQEMQAASGDELKSLRHELSLKRKALKESQVETAVGTTVNLSAKWNRMAKPSITVKTVLARWMGEREVVAPVRCRGRDMAELLNSCNDRLSKQASRPRRMFKKTGEEITGDFDKLTSGKLTEEVWVSMGESYLTRDQMKLRRRQKAKLAAVVRQARPATGKSQK